MHYLKVLVETENWLKQVVKIMPGDGAKVRAGEMELSPMTLAEKEPLNPGQSPSQSTNQSCKRAVQ